MPTEQLDEKQRTILNPVAPNWVTNASVLWEYRRLLLRTFAIALIASLVIAFVIPKRYESTARIMPPENASSSTALLTALAGRGMGGLGGFSSLAGSILGARTSGPLFVDLLRSSTVSGHLIDRFQLQQVYSKRYRVDTAKKLTHRTAIVEDKRSGVISITVEDSDPRRARDLAQAYLDELDSLVNRTNTSSAHQERTFIENRLHSADADLERAQLDMSEFASTHTAIDIKEQTRATVDAAARLQAQLIVEQSDLDSLKQIYGDENVRVRAANARISSLQHDLEKIGGTSAPLQPDAVVETQNSPSLERSGFAYPSLRQIPRLAVPYADIYRRVRVQEAVYEMLTQQYEIARIQEAKEVPVVRIIDAPGIPEKKSFPPRTLLTILLTALAVMFVGSQILIRHYWDLAGVSDPRKILGEQIAANLRNQFTRIRSGVWRQRGSSPIQ